jgi:hypothetical protein
VSILIIKNGVPSQVRRFLLVALAGWRKDLDGQTKCVSQNKTNLSKLAIPAPGMV